MFHLPFKVADPRYFKQAPLPSLRLLPLAMAARLLVHLAVNRPPAEG